MQFRSIFLLLSSVVIMSNSIAAYSKQPFKEKLSNIFEVTSHFDDCKRAGWCPDMIIVQSGNFMMGSPETEGARYEDEGPQRKVSIKTFAVSKFEITRGQFDHFIQDTGHSIDNTCWTFENNIFKRRIYRSYIKPGFEQDDYHPVVCVNWHDAKAYTKWLSEKTGKTYRLLSEAEWEYVARAGTTSAYSFGEDLDNLCDYGNASDWIIHSVTQVVKCSYRPSKRTTIVGSFRPNPFGVYDVHGNAYEWVEDCWHESYQGAPIDGRAWLDEGEGNCERRIIRGGAWDLSANQLRSAYRYWYNPNIRIDNIGFRVARDLEEGER